MHRPIDIAGYPPVEPVSRALGKLPRLEWIEIALLVADGAYQRPLERRGRTNILKIATHFDWSKFSPVIVAPNGDRFAIIDGQHRTTAAALRNIKKVPCQIVTMTQAEQASAFRAINANVTALTRMAIHAAAVVAKDPDAMEIDRICKVSGVAICAYPKPASLMMRGETLAIGAMANNLRRFGDKVLILALRLITETRDGNAGFIRAPIISALCATLDAEPAWMKAEKKLLRAMQSFDLPAAWGAAIVAAGGGDQKCRTVEALIERIGDHLDKHMGAAAA
jgi:hypothetical protein